MFLQPLFVMNHIWFGFGYYLRLIVSIDLARTSVSGHQYPSEDLVARVTDGSN
jgi:hypothetical protein